MLSNACLVVSVMERIAEVRKEMQVFDRVVDGETVRHFAQDEKCFLFCQNTCSRDAGAELGEEF